MATLNLNQALQSGGLKVNYTPPASKPVPKAPPNPSQRGVLGSSVGPSGGSPVSGSSAAMNNAPMQEAPQAPSIDFDALIRPAIEGLESAIGPLQQSNAADLQGIESSRQSQIATTNQSIGAQTNTIGQAKDTQRGYENSAADEARRQYSEVQQGLQARYGGTTGTGAFATELAGGQTIRSIAGIHEAASKAIAGLDDKLVQVQEIGRIALQDIDNQAKDQTAKAKSNLELALSDIRNQKGQLLARKAELAANAVQMYQQTVNQVNANNTAFKQQLYLQQQQAEQQLAAARGRASSITSGANPTDLSGLVQGLSIPDGYSASISQKLPGGGNINLTKNKQDDTASLLKELGL